MTQSQSQLLAILQATTDPHNAAARNQAVASTSAYAKMVDHRKAAALAKAQKAHVDRQAQKAQAEREELEKYFRAPKWSPNQPDPKASDDEMVGRGLAALERRKPGQAQQWQKLLVPRPWNKADVLKALEKLVVSKVQLLNFSALFDHRLGCMCIRWGASPAPHTPEHSPVMLLPLTLQVRQLLRRRTQPPASPSTCRKQDSSEVSCGGADTRCMCICWGSSPAPHTPDHAPGLSPMCAPHPAGLTSPYDELWQEGGPLQVSLAQL
jgi:hypothetical protein